MNPRPGAPAVRPLRDFEHVHRHWDGINNIWVAHLLPGEFYVSNADEIISTVLGSCVSTCMRDPDAGIGGMNHFLLPDDPRADSAGNALRYGCFAVERLINELLKRGAQRHRLETKVFGGGQVIAASSDIGAANVAFVHDYLADEGLRIWAEDVGDKVARRLRYHPLTGRALLKHLPIQQAAKIRAREQDFRNQLLDRKPGEVDLF